jgi:hypothetical protein
MEQPHGTYNYSNRWGDEHETDCDRRGLLCLASVVASAATPGKRRARCGTNPKNWKTC